MKRSFAAIVERTSKWDHSKPPQEQPGFAAHAEYMGGLQQEGLIVLAGLMLASNDVLFVLEAESREEVDDRLAQDPWRRDGYTRLGRLEELAIRPSPPPSTDA